MHSHAQAVTCGSKRKPAADGLCVQTKRLRHFVDDMHDDASEVSDFVMTENCPITPPANDRDPNPMLELEASRQRRSRSLESAKYHLACVMKQHEAAGRSFGFETGQFWLSKVINDRKRQELRRLALQADLHLMGLAEDD